MKSVLLFVVVVSALTLGAPTLDLTVGIIVMLGQ